MQCAILGWVGLNIDVPPQHLNNGWAIQALLIQTTGPFHLAAHHGHWSAPQQQFNSLNDITYITIDQTEHQDYVSAL